MTHIKICGMTNEKDVNHAIACGANFIGLIFAASKRKIIKETARRIITSTPGFSNYVGVFLNGKKREIEDICEYTGLRIIQLHGDETPAFCNYFKNRGFSIIKAFRIKDKSSFDLVTQYDKVDYYLFDTYHNGQYGGTGQTFDWTIINSVPSLNNKKYFVSGGLDAENVKTLLATIRPFGVDSSSRLESKPGQKEPHKIKDFCHTVKKVVTHEID